VPDRYSLTLEVSRNRTTTASKVVCNSVDPSVPSCPPGYVEGQVYVERSLNQPCNVSVTVGPNRQSINQKVS